MNAKRRILYIGGIVTAVVIVSAATLRTTAETVAAPAAAPKPALTVAIESPRRTSMADRLKAHGNVQAWQEASIGAEVNGLRLAEVRVSVGDRVRRGEVLAVFASDTVQADVDQAAASVVEAEASAADAKANADRARSLVSTGALSDQQINQFVTAEQTAVARLKAQRAVLETHRLRLDKTRVLASDDGVISARTATVGAVVPMGQEMFRLIRQGRLEWRAELTAEELARLRPGSIATIEAPGGARIDGKVRIIAPTVDVHTRLGIAYVDLPCDRTLKAGIFSQGEFALGESDVLTVAQQAIVVRDGFSYVFQLVGDDRVEQIKVRTGRRNGDRVELLDIQPDARLVANGAGFLNDGDVVKVVALDATPESGGAAPTSPVYANNGPVRL